MCEALFWIGVDGFEPDFCQSFYCSSKNSASFLVSEWRSVSAHFLGSKCLNSRPSDTRSLWTSLAIFGAANIPLTWRSALLLIASMYFES